MKQEDDTSPMLATSVGMNNLRQVVLTQGGGDIWGRTTMTFTPAFARHLGRMLIETADYAEGKPLRIRRRRR